MASDLVVEYSMKDPEVEATAALSLFGRDVTATNPKNLIVIDGAWETSMLTDAGFRIVGMAAEGPARERVTYGDVSQGDGRRFVLAAGAEHIGVLYSRDALQRNRRVDERNFRTPRSRLRRSAREMVGAAVPRARRDWPFPPRACCRSSRRRPSERAWAGGGWRLWPLRPRY